MFLRFSKGAYFKTNKQKTRKAVFLGSTVVMEYGDNIVGIAKLYEDGEKCLDYDVVVAARCELGADAIARFIKDMIGKSNKFSTNPTDKRRKYYVEEVDCEVLPIKAEIKLSRIATPPPTKDEIRKCVATICKEKEKDFYYEVWIDYEDYFEQDIEPKIKGMNIEQASLFVFNYLEDLDKWYWSPDYIKQMNEAIKDVKF